MTKDEALREAIDTLKQTKHGNCDYAWIDGTIKKCTAALAQPEQEPVAWRDPTNIDPGQGCTYSKERREKWPHIYRQALYTAPPAAQRPWVGLTPEEMKHLYPYGRSVWGKETYEAIEKALKKRNHG